MIHKLGSFCSWLHGMTLAHAIPRANEIFERYTQVYLERKPVKARSWRAEAHVKHEFKLLIENRPPRELQFSDFFNAGSGSQQPIAKHRHICFTRKPKKKLNTYQVLRFIKERDIP